MPNNNLISHELRKIREKHHITNEEWSAKSGVPIGSLKRFTGRSVNIPNFPAVCAMLVCLGESIDEFYGRINAKVNTPAEALKLASVPVGVLTDEVVDMPDTKAEIQERIILQAEEMQRLKAAEYEKDMQIEMLEVRLEMAERVLEAIRTLCEPK